MQAQIHIQISDSLFSRSKTQDNEILAYMGKVACCAAENQIQINEASTERCYDMYVCRGWGRARAQSNSKATGKSRSGAGVPVGGVSPPGGSPERAPRHRMPGCTKGAVFSCRRLLGAVSASPFV